MAYARGNLGKLNYGASRVGSRHHVIGALFHYWAGINTVHIPYTGAGYKEMNGFSWTVLFGPAGMPKDVVAVTGAAVSKALVDSTINTRLSAIGAEPVPDTTPEKTAAFVREKFERWGPSVKLSGATVDQGPCPAGHRGPGASATSPRWRKSASVLGASPRNAT